MTVLQVTLHTPEIVAGVIGIATVALGPGGVFYFLVKKGLDGSVKAIGRIEEAQTKLLEEFKSDHDVLTRASAILEKVDTRCDGLEDLVGIHGISIAKIKATCEAMKEKQLREGGK